MWFPKTMSWWLKQNVAIRGLKSKRRNIRSQRHVRATVENLEDRSLLAVSALGTTTSQLAITNILASFTVDAGTDRLLVVAVGDPDSPTAPSAVTYNNVAMFPGNSVSDSFFASDGIFYLQLGTSASATTANIVVTTTGVKERFIAASAFSGVDQVTPVDINGPTFGATGTNVGSSLNVTSETGDLVFDIFDAFLLSSAPAITTGLDQTRTNDQAGALTSASTGFGHYVTSTEPGAATVTMSWTSTADAVLHATMNINQSTASNVAPTVTTDPTNATIAAGQTAQFTAAASGTPAPTVQWQESTDGGANYSNIADGTFSGVTFAGTTTGTLSVTPASSSATGRKYRAVFTNVNGNATSTGATLTVTASAVTLSGNTLVLGDGDATVENNQYTIVRTPAGFQISDASGATIATAIPGATGSGTNSIVVPFGTIDAITVNGGAGNDALTVDYSGGAIPTLNYDGGSQSSVPGDSLTVTGGARRPSKPSTSPTTTTEVWSSPVRLPEPSTTPASSQSFPISTPQMSVWSTRGRPKPLR